MSVVAIREKVNDIYLCIYLVYPFDEEDIKLITLLKDKFNFVPKYVWEIECTKETSEELEKTLININGVFKWR